MKLCVTETVRHDRIERMISDETVMVVSSPVMLRRKKKALHPTIRGLVRLQQYSAALYSDFIAIEGLYADSDTRTYFDCDYKEWQRRHNLQNKIDATKSYWWICSSKRGPRDLTFEYLFNTQSHAITINDIETKFYEDYIAKRNWGVLRYGEAIPILRKYKIINKLLDELMVVKLTE